MLRYPGRRLAPGEFVPPAVVDFIGRQLDLDGDELADYAVRSETRTARPRRQLPPAMRREAMHNGWPGDSPDAYPVVARRDPDGVPRPLVERDVETVAAAALDLAAFLPKHAATFKAETFTPVCESYFDDDDREVRFTVPYEAAGLFDSRRGRGAGRHGDALRRPITALL